MSSKLSIALIVTLWAWLLVILITHNGKQETIKPGLVQLQGTHLPSATPQSTPTIDRLAAPPTVENPTQADEGAQLFWLHCQPCHGDVGQGLTDEWRQQYPPEDQDCWTSGCHGRRPYENGFMLPTAVPAVTGQDSLERFLTMGQVYSFIVAAMPYQDPGHLSEEEYLAITAFLARANNLWDGTPLTTENVGNFRLRPAEATSTIASSVPAEGQPNSQNGNQSQPEETINTFIIGLGVGIIGSLFVIFILLQRRIK
jgi:cytochrome c